MALLDNTFKNMLANTNDVVVSAFVVVVVAAAAAAVVVAEEEALEEGSAMNSTAILTAT